MGPDGAVQSIDFRPLYEALDAHLAELNLEGGVVDGDDVLLAQRGNGATRNNALIRLKRDVFEAELSRGVVSGRGLIDVTPVALPGFKLGEKNVPLSLTDLGVGPRGERLFTAAAEDTTNPYDDGVVAGSVVGVIERDGRVTIHAQLPQVKLEGVCWVNVAGGELRLVADPDNPSARAPMYRLLWKG